MTDQDQFRDPPPSFWFNNLAGALLQYERTPWWRWRTRRAHLWRALAYMRRAACMPPHYERDYWVYHQATAAVFRQPTTDRSARHALLHRSLDELVANWVRQCLRPGRTLATTSIMELIEWSQEQTKQQTDPDA